MVSDLYGNTFDYFVPADAVNGAFALVEEEEGLALGFITIFEECRREFQSPCLLYDCSDAVSWAKACCSQ